MTEKEPLVLIIEDNVANFVLVARMLGYLGIRAEWGAGGSEFLEEVHRLEPDLILLDIRLAYRDGYAVFKELTSHEETKRIPVVVITAEASQAQRDKALSYGVADFIPKPLDPDEFPGQMRNIFRGIRLGLYDTE